MYQIKRITGNLDLVNEWLRDNSREIIVIGIQATIYLNRGCYFITYKQL